ncbi:MAG: hypothetical protein E7317_02950 [Clostridiales bacterium]|nr:hypothetical protein [Clostridiales bacterium]
MALAMGVAFCAIGVIMMLKAVLWPTAYTPATATLVRLQVTDSAGLVEPIVRFTLDGKEVTARCAHVASRGLSCKPGDTVSIAYSKGRLLNMGTLKVTLGSENAGRRDRTRAVLAGAVFVLAGLFVIVFFRRLLMSF